MILSDINIESSGAAERVLSRSIKQIMATEQGDASAKDGRPRAATPSAPDSTKTSCSTAVALPRVAITFCTQCHWMLRAAYVRRTSFFYFLLDTLSLYLHIFLPCFLFPQLFSVSIPPFIPSASSFYLQYI